MRFVKLRSYVLRRLRNQGYNILRSTSPISSKNPSWYPDIVDLEKFLHWDSEGVQNLSVPSNKTHLLIIQDALDNIRDEDFIGEVWI